MTLINLIYVLCLAVSGVCVFFLLRGWRESRVRLLLWSAIGFTGIALNNLLLVIDTQIAADLSVWRGAPALIGITIFIWGLVEERGR
ncbi:MAG: hypothetical protein JJE51_14915 [Thermoanaerobaculia bacterium]|nr:hypothetical protein [Thermoanaerobaculia bacterium]